MSGAGKALPLVAISAVSALWGNRITDWLVSRRRTFSLLTGALMAAVSLYGLFGVFRVQDVPNRGWESVNGDVRREILFRWRCRHRNPLI